MADNVADGIAKARAAGYSDDEIAAHLAETNPGFKKAREAGYSNSEILGHLAGTTPAETPAAPAAPAAPASTDVVGYHPELGPLGVGVPLAINAAANPTDMVKSVDAGIGKGLTTALGAPGDLASLAHSVAPQSVIDKVKAIPGAKWLYNHLPGSDALKATIPTDFSSNYNKDAEYTPTSGPGRYAKAIATQVPAMATGVGAPAAIGAGVGGQLASDMSGGNKVAEALGGVAGGFAGPLAAASAARRAMTALHDADAVKTIANAQYADPAIAGTTLSPQGAVNVAHDMRDELATASTPFMPAQAPRTHAAIDALAERGAPSAPQLTPQQQLQMQMNWQTPPPPVPAAPVSIAELHSFRKTLGEVAEGTQDFKPTEEALAAMRTKRVLDQYLENIPTHDVLAGAPDDAVQSLRDAGGNWRAMSNADKVGTAIGNAIEQNASTNSAMNLGNILRQKFRPFLMNDGAKMEQMGFTAPDEIAAMQRVVRGDGVTNLYRRASNMLGGGGGIASTLIGHGISSGAGGAAGYEEGGLPGMLAGTVLGAVPGQALRVMANRRTLAAARAVQEAMLAKAPANAAIVAANNAARAANRSNTLRALGQGVPASIQAILNAAR